MTISLHQEMHILIVYSLTSCVLVHLYFISIVIVINQIDVDHVILHVIMVIKCKKS